MTPRAAVLIEAALAVVVILGTLDFLSSMGPAFHARGDDPTYITHALEQHEAPPAWGPVYTGTLALFVDDAEAANRQFADFVRVLFTALVAAFYLALRTGGVPVGAALVFTLLLVLSGINPYRMEQARIGSSFISHLAVLCILLSLIVANRMRAGEPERIGVVACGLFLAAYIRPELLIASIGLFALYLWTVFRPQVKANRTPQRKWLLFGILSAAALWAWSWGGLPMGGPGAQSRQDMAFGQHFAINLRQWEPEKIPDGKNPWTDWKYFSDSHFGGARGVLDSALSNPPAFTQHLARNLANLARVVWHMFLEVPFQRGSGGLWRVLQTGLLALALYLLYPGRADRGGPTDGAKGRWLLPIALVVAVPSLLSSLLFYPRDHYVIFIGVMGLLAAALTWYRRDPPRRPGEDVPLLVCALFLAAMHLAPRGGF